MKFKAPVGIVSYGSYLPKAAILGTEIGAAHGGDGSQARQLGVVQKTVAGIDEDTITLATAAAEQALLSCSKEEKEQHIQALFIGSESHPYAVKPSGTVVKQALGLGEQMALADVQFACKAGTQSLQVVMSYVASGMAQLGLAIGADTAQSKPGDVLEFTAAAGAAAYLVGAEKIIARCLGTVSIATDTPDFWRRPGQLYPEHAGRFSGEPGYFYHVRTASTLLMEELGMEAKDFTWCAFHTPNAKFPKTVAAKLGFIPEQLAPALVVQQIGNTYAAASLLALAAVLDQAESGQKILLCSYGSGSGADAFVFETTAELANYKAAMAKESRRRTVHGDIAELQHISYQQYRKQTGLGQ